MITVPASQLQQFRQDLLNFARTMPSSKVLSQEEGYPANLPVDAVLCLKTCTIVLLVVTKTSLSALKRRETGASAENMPSHCQFCAQHICNCSSFRASGKRQ